MVPKTLSGKKVLQYLKYESKTKGDFPSGNRYDTRLF